MHLDIVAHSPLFVLVLHSFISHPLFCYSHPPIASYAPKGKLTAHTAPVAHLDWSVDGAHVQSSCVGYELLFHDVGSAANLAAAKQNGHAIALKNVQWASHSLPFGWCVKGLINGGIAGHFYNGITRSHGGDLIATGDDEGLVRLWRNPIGDAYNACARFKAHSSHCQRLVFAADDAHLFTTGGNDKTLMQVCVCATRGSAVLCLRSTLCAVLVCVAAVSVSVQMRPCSRHAHHTIASSPSRRRYFFCVRFLGYKIFGCRPSLFLIYFFFFYFFFWLLFGPILPTVARNSRRCRRRRARRRAHQGQSARGARRTFCGGRGGRWQGGGQ